MSKSPATKRAKTEMSTEKVFREEELEVYEVPERVSKGAHLSGMDDYAAAYKESIEHNEAFWDSVSVDASQNYIYYSFSRHRKQKSICLGFLHTPKCSLGALLNAKAVCTKIFKKLFRCMCLDTCISLQEKQIYSYFFCFPRLIVCSERFWRATSLGF